jgi:hypothetical protein
MNTPFLRRHAETAVSAVIFSLLMLILLAAVLLCSGCAQFSNVHNWITPTPKPTPAPTDILAEEKQQGFDYAKVQFLYGCKAPSSPLPTVLMRSCGVDDSGTVMSCDYESVRGKWIGNNDPPGDGCCGLVLMFARQPDGIWVGGHFDDIGFEQRDRPLQHIWNQASETYQGAWREPENGTPVCFVIVSYDGSPSSFGRERTTAGFTIWQRPSRPSATASRRYRETSK